ncbi:MAG: M20 family metallopeptidase [Rhodobacteraceae bacterium]|nr:M20 family metallopeptidase [Paracoccaceae bacterium]
MKHDGRDLADTIREITDRIADRLIKIRRAIHRHPELGFEEFKTSALVSDYLEDTDIPHRTGVGKTGVVGLIEGVSDGPTVLVRGDMDALPLQEVSGLPFASEVRGKMHACGHDGHTAILLGVASVLNQLRDSFRGRVKLVFQPAEEGLMGAQAMVDDGVLENPSVDCCIGFHNWPPLPAGTVGYHPSVAFSSSDPFDLVLSGVAGHAAHPHLSVDVVVAAGQFLNQLQTLVSREIAPVHCAVVSVSVIKGGTARNTLPDSVMLQGTVRTQNSNVRETIKAAMRRLLEGLKVGMRIEYDLSFHDGVPMFENDPETLRAVLTAVRAALGKKNVIELPEGSMGSEDFAIMSHQHPRVHLRIGSKIDGYETALHRNNFNFNESAIPTGIRAVSHGTIAILQTAGGENG